MAGRPHSRLLTSTSAPTHPTHALPIYTAVLSWFFVVACAAGGVYAAAVGGDDHPMIAAAILLAGAVLAAAGWLAATRDSPWLAVALVTLGALVVGVLFFWAILAVPVSIALIVLFVMDARRGSSTAVRPAV
jgi:hypothetical protein